MFRSNGLRVILALGALLLGTSVYILDRPPESTWFVMATPLSISLHHKLPALFGTCGGWLADFCHVYAFILLTAAACRCSHRWIFLIGAGWWLVECIFELGQKYFNSLSNLPLSNPIVMLWTNYFANGHYDPMDIMAFSIGAAAAIATCYLTEPIKREEQT